jgi:GNAT superfamily N-acetyltransferase
MGKFYIRRAMVSDAPALQTMGMAVHQESPELRDLPYDAAGLLNYLANSTLDHLQYDIGFQVCVLHGQLVGMVVSERVKYFFSTASYAFNNVIYVDPRFRKHTRVAYLLARAHEDWAVIAGCKHVTLNTITGIEPERTARFFTSLGFRQIGSIHKKEL